MRMSSYCGGLVPSVSSIGGKIWRGGTGHSGNHWLKWIFVEVSWVAIASMPDLRLRFDRIKARKGPQVAIRGMCAASFRSGLCTFEITALLSNKPFGACLRRLVVALIGDEPARLRHGRDAAVGKWFRVSGLPNRSIYSKVHKYSAMPFSTVMSKAD